MGQLAQSNGQSDGVKSYGKMLETDHTAANEKAMDAAKTMGMTSPTGPDAKQKAEYDKMSKMSGAQFDKAFAKHMVADHKKDIAEYKKEARQRMPPVNMQALRLILCRSTWTPPSHSKPRSS